MRILLVPDGYPDLGPDEVGAAVTDGWGRVAPGDELDVVVPRRGLIPLRPELDTQAADLSARIARTDLVLAVTGALDPVSVASSTLPWLAGLAAEHARPVVALAASTGVGTRELRAIGVEAAYDVGEVTTGGDGPPDALAALAAAAARVARTWSA